MNKICRIVTKFSFNWYRITNWPIPVIFLSREKKLASFPYCFKIGVSFFKHQRSVDNKRSKDSCDTLIFFIALSRVTEKKRFTPILSKIFKKNTKNVNQ